MIFLDAQFFWLFFNTGSSFITTEMQKFFRFCFFSPVQKFAFISLGNYVLEGSAKNDNEASQKDF